MKKIYVHLGFPKTASTWFKEFFKNHTDINLIFDKKKISIVKLINDEKNFDKLYEMIHEKYDPKKVNILSDEDFLNPLFKTSVLNNFDYTVNLHNLRIFLKEFDFNIFYFYRRQEELIPSYISQNYSFLFKLKKYYSLNNTKNFTDYFLLDYKDQKNYRLRNLFDGFKFNNLNLKLFELFGIDKVNSFSFNEFESEKELFFKNFCKYLNIDYVKMLEVKNDKYINKLKISCNTYRINFKTETKNYYKHVRSNIFKFFIQKNKIRKINTFIYYLKINLVENIQLILGGYRKLHFKENELYLIKKYYNQDNQYLKKIQNN